MVRGSNSDDGEIFRNYLDRPWGPSSLLYNDYMVFFPRVQRLGLGVYHPPASVPDIKKDYIYISASPLDLHDLFQGELYLFHN
jgi:hypothetical protein